MNKLFTKIAGLALGLSMAIGVGIAVGTSGKDAARVDATAVGGTDTIDSSKLDLSGTGNTSWTSGNITSNTSGASYSYRFMGSKSTTDDRIAGTNANGGIWTTSSGGVLNSVTVTTTTSKALALYGGTSAFTAYNDTSDRTSFGNGTTSGSSSTYSYTWSGLSTSNCTHVLLKGTASSTFIKSIEFVWDAPGADPEIALSKTAITVSKGEDATFIVTTANLTSNFSVTGGDTNYFTTSYTASSADDDHVVTLHGVEVTSSPITLTVSATGATSQTISVSVVEAVYYEKVTAVSEIKNGREIIIGTTDGTAVLGKYVSGNNCPSLPNVPNANGKLIESSLPEDVAILTVGGASSPWSLTDQDSNVYYGVSGSNNLKASGSSADTWSISINASGVATITSTASSRIIKKNTSDPLFNTYQSGQTDVSIYMIATTDPEIQVTVTGSQSLGIGETATLTATKVNGATGTVSWATSDSSKLSLSASTGDSVTVTAGSTLGSVSITASLSGCDDVVTPFTVRRGSATAPYTVAQAKDAIDGSDAGAKTGVYTAGIISQVDSLNSDNSITYWISDNGTTTDQMEAYKGLGLNSATFSSVDDLQVGDEVVIYGNLTLYNTTYEYAAGNHLYSFNRPVVALDTITAIEGTLTAKAGDAAWDLSGLTVKGTYTGSATVVDVTALVDLTTSDVPGTPASTTVRNVSVTATGKDDSTITYTQDVQGTINVTSGLVADGQYRIKATRDSVTYYLKENGTNSAPSAVTDFWEATIFTFTLVADDTYTISQGDNYLYCTATNNGVRFGDTSTATSERWTISAGESTLNGSYNFYSASGSRYLSLYNAADWRGYGDATANNRKENTDLEAFDAVQFSSEFLSTYTAGCNVNGGYTAENMKWSTANTQYGFLSSVNKALLTNAEYTKTGSGSNTQVTAVNGTNQTVAEAAARYDYIVGMHGTATFGDFLGRSPAAIGGVNVTSIFGIDNNSNTTVSIIVVISIIGVASLSGYFFMRKRKEQ